MFFSLNELFELWMENDKLWVLEFLFLCNRDYFPPSLSFTENPHNQPCTPLQRPIAVSVRVPPSSSRFLASH